MVFEEPTERMRIALLAPFEEQVPPDKYGGTERVVYNIAEGLVSLGHDVTLLASGDSQTSAKLVPCSKQALRSYLDRPRTMLFLQWQGFHRIVEHLQTHTYDIVHNHGDWPFLIASAFTKAPLITTIHNPKQFKLGVKATYERYSYISISDAQRKYLPTLNYLATVHNGIDTAKFEFSSRPGQYLAFLGRIHPDKGLKEAIDIVRATKQKLIIGAKLDPSFQPYFRKVIQPFIDNKQVVFLGEIGHKAKVDLLKNAKALLSPIQWDEPFGLTNIEAMACGTPVIAIARGSLPEIVRDGITGYLCKNVEEMIAAVDTIDKIKRYACRQHAEQHFSAHCMAKKYVEVYQQAILAQAQYIQQQFIYTQDSPRSRVLNPYRFVFGQPTHLTQTILRRTIKLPKIPRIDTETP